MGKSLKGLLMIGKKSSKLSSFLQHAIDRTALLKKRQQVLFSICHSDIVELFQHGYEEHALLRVEHLVKSKNMLDTLDMVKSYCQFLRQELPLISRSKECPDELREAISSLVFASKRLGSLPELQNIREFFTSLFGKEYTSQAVEFPRFLGVNDKIVQKLSKQKRSHESGVGFLQKIAEEIGTTLYLSVDVTEN